MEDDGIESRRALDGQDWGLREPRGGKGADRKRGRETRTGWGARDRARARKSSSERHASWSLCGSHGITVWRRELVWQ